MLYYIGLLMILFILPGCFDCDMCKPSKQQQQTHHQDNTQQHSNHQQNIPQQNNSNLQHPGYTHPMNNPHNQPHAQQGNPGNPNLAQQASPTHHMPQNQHYGQAPHMQANTHPAQNHTINSMQSHHQAPGNQAQQSNIAHPNNVHSVQPYHAPAIPNQPHAPKTH